MSGEVPTPTALVEVHVPETPEVTGGAATAANPLAGVGNCTLARSVARDAAAPSAQGAAMPVGSRCKCGGLVLAGGECTNCMSGRMRSEGASDEQVSRAVSARMELSGFTVARRFTRSDERVSEGLADAVRRRRVDRTQAPLSAAPARMAARGPLDWLEEGADWVGDRADDVGDAAGGAADWVSDRADDVGEAAGDAAEWVDDRAGDVAEGAHDAADWVDENVGGGEYARGAADWVEDRTEDVSDAAHGAADWVGDRTEDVSDATQGAADWIQGGTDWVSDQVRDVFGGGRARAAKKERAQAICKCVGDDACGGGKIHKKYFHVDDCRDAKLEAEKICNNDPEMIAKCTRPKCYYRHGDYKCPA